MELVRGADPGRLTATRWAPRENAGSPRAAEVSSSLYTIGDCHLVAGGFISESLSFVTCKIETIIYLAKLLGLNEMLHEKQIAMADAK